MKRVFAILCAVIVMACAVVPCFASNWSEESPEYAGNATIPGAEYPFLSIQLQIRVIVEKATTLGMFGGGKPVFLVYYFNANSTSANIMVAVPAHTIGTIYSAEGLPKFSTYVTKYTNMANSATVANSHDGARDFILFQLCSNGDWAPVQWYGAGNGVSLSQSTPGGNQTVFKFVASWGQVSVPAEWYQGTALNASVRTGWDETSTPQNATLSSIIARYDRAIEGTVGEVPAPEIPTTPILLDAPAIFDGMFNGLRSVLGAFDLNVFGISIAGMLVAFIVIAVVAFIVRKLWK